MKGNFISVLHLVLFVVEGFSNGLDKPFVPNKRVINGQNADIHEWPWQISLRVNGQHICGGSLIKPGWVLTAAHCVEWKPLPTMYQVAVGVHEDKGTTAAQKVYTLKQVIVHEEFHNSVLRNDIALLQLNGSVVLTTKVNIIQLPQQGKKVEVGLHCFITGWGYTHGGGRPNILQEAHLPIGQEKDCLEMFPELLHSETMICAGGKGKGGCQGDSGGPLACLEDGQWILRGIVSFGRADCSPDHYTVFARVSSLVGWIEDMIKTRGICKDQFPTSHCERMKFNCKSYGHAILRKKCRKTCRQC